MFEMKLNTCALSISHSCDICQLTHSEPVECLPTKSCEILFEVVAHNFLKDQERQEDEITCGEEYYDPPLLCP